MPDPFPNKGPQDFGGVPGYSPGHQLFDPSLYAGGGGHGATSGIVAARGGGQTAATPLRDAINRITVCAADGDSVALPPAIGGQMLVLINDGAAVAQLFAAKTTSDTINGISGTTGTTLPVATTALLISAAPGAWSSIPTPAGDVGSGADAGVSSFNARTGDVVLTTADVADAIGYTPYDAANPAGYVTAAGAAGAAPVQSVSARTGAVVLAHTDITDWTATLAPYALTSSVPLGSSVPPPMDGLAAAGMAAAWSRGDHVHPVDISRAPALGVTDGSNAAAGHVGEYLSTTVLGANAVGANTGVVVNVGSLALTPGDWDVQGQIWIAATGTDLMAAVQITGIAAWVSPVSATIPTVPAGSLQAFMGVQTALSSTYLPVLTSGRVRFSVAVSTTIYLGGIVTFTGAGPLGLYGFVGARRMR